MATQLSKADRIRKLLHLSNAEIAKRVGCLPDYVRAVRQRTSESGNPIEPPTGRVWKEANSDRVAAYVQISKQRIKADPKKRARYLAYHRNRSRQRRAEARAS